MIVVYTIVSKAGSANGLILQILLHSQTAWHTKPNCGQKTTKHEITLILCKSQHEPYVTSFRQSIYRIKYLELQT